MKNTITSNIKQAIFSKSFVIGVCAFILLIFFSLTENITEAVRAESLQANGFHGALIINALVSDAIILALPIICALPYTTSFIDDIKSGFIKEYLPRTNIKSYLSGKVIACALSGGLVLTIGVLVSYGMATLLFSPMEAALAKGVEAQPYFAQLMGKALLFFFCGAFLSVLGMTFATLTGSKYMAYASPFVLYYILIILYERYFDTLYVLYPKEWLNPSDKWMFGNLGVILLMTEFIVIVALCFCAAAKRRIGQI